jgi:tetratricopeptide (TPR) repeat protein
MKRVLLLCLGVWLLAQAAKPLDEATRLFQNREFKQAVSLLEPYVREHPSERGARYLLALSLQQAEQLNAAESHLRYIVAREPAWAPGHYALARVLFFQGRFDDAIASARKAAALGEPEKRVEHLIGSIEEERGKLTEALAAFTRADAQAGRASVLYKLGRYAEARKAADAALRADPRDAEALRVSKQLERATDAAPVAGGAPVSFVRVPFPFVLEHHPTAEKHLVSTMAGGLAVFDYDRDGLLDLFFTNGAAVPSFEKTDPKYFNRLYRNLGNWKFEDVTEAAGLRGEGFSMGAAVADFDADGWVDLFVAGAGKNLLYRNVHGRFERIPGIRDEKWSSAGAWLDYDRDGLLDLFVVNYLDWTPELNKYCGEPDRGIRVYCHPREFNGTANRLYRNLGSGRFEDVSKSSGIAGHIGKGMSAAVADYDGDGLPDIFVTNDSAPNFLFRNLGNGRFEEVGLTAGVALNDLGKPVSSMGAVFDDYDNDGRPDILVTALAGETFPLFRNLGAGFMDATYPSRSGLATARRSGWGVALADLNNDGWKDIVTANSHVTDNIERIRSERYLEPNLILLNQGGRFGEATELGPPAPHRGLIAADLDEDGRLDLVVSVLGAPAGVWRNTTERAGRYVRARAPYGSVVRVGKQMQQVYSAVGYASSIAAPLHFGIGDQGSVDVEVIDRAKRSVFQNVRSGQTVP